MAYITSPLNADSKVNVKMPDGSIRVAGTRAITDDGFMAAALGYTHWPYIEGYVVLTTGGLDNWSAKPSNPAEGR